MTSDVSFWKMIISMLVVVLLVHTGTTSTFHNDNTEDEYYGIPNRVKFHLLRKIVPQYHGLKQRIILYNSIVSESRKQHSLEQWFKTSAINSATDNIDALFKSGLNSKFNIPSDYLSKSLFKTRQKETQEFGKSEILNNILRDVRAEDPDADRNLTELIISQGYPVLRYVVQTKDGYLLDLHRIPHGRKGYEEKNYGDDDYDRVNINDEVNFTNDDASKVLYNHNDNNINDRTVEKEEKKSRGTKPVVFLQHGYTSSACDFVMNFASNSLAFVLADAGYDVWMGNSRGNTYSRRHASLSPDDDRFWDWSFDEMAKYDTSAFIDFILAHTSQPSLYYIGHSQGTMVAFSLLSQQPEYQEKIRLFVGLAPITSLSNMKSPMKYLAHLDDSSLYQALGRKSCFLSNNKTKHTANTLCANPATRWVCYSLLFLTNGPDLSNLNQTRLPVYMSHTPAGTSVKNVVHFAQMVREKRFAMYNYGTAQDNFKHYGQTTPPAYNISKINSVPSLLFSAAKDWLADPTDVSILEDTLPNIKGTFKYPSWNHMDFVLGENAADTCYGDILKWLPKF